MVNETRALEALERMAEVITGTTGIEEDHYHNVTFIEISLPPGV